MAGIGFDTLQLTNRLKQAGLTEEQATAIAEAQKEAFAEALDHSLATKLISPAWRQSWIMRPRC